VCVCAVNVDRDDGGWDFRLSSRRFLFCGRKWKVHWTQFKLESAVCTFLLQSFHFLNAFWGGFFVSNFNYLTSLKMKIYMQKVIINSTSEK
jgi:hypothetical protein